MKNKLTLDWILAAVVRMVRTMAQTALGMLTIGAAISDIQWVQVFSVSFVAGVYSFLLSLSTGLPEVGMDGTLQIDTNGDKDIYRLQLNTELFNLVRRTHVTLKVDPKANLSQE